MVAMSPATDAPTNELGAPGISSVLGGWLDTWEETAELRFPLNLAVYDRMRNDAQVDAVLRAIVLAILRTRCRLEGEDVRPEVTRFCTTELGLEERGRRGTRRRRREGIVFDEFLRHALLMLPFGFMAFEQVYDPGPPAPGQGEGLPDVVAHLRKLAPRMPRTISGIEVARDGGLEAIRQYVPGAGGSATAGFTQEIRIPRDRLVMFVNEREGGNWSGRSILRSAYPHWLVKQALMRLGPIIIERNGMGIPVVTYPMGGDEQKALGLAKALRAGEEAGAAVPEGYKVELLGVNGHIKDELPLLRYHDEAIGRAALAMFLNLGHDRGARSLGETFVDFFVAALGAVLNEVEGIVTEYVIRDMVELTFGADEAYPELVFDELTAESAPTAEALARLADVGLIIPDDDLRSDIRRRYRLPPPPEVSLPPDVVVDVPAGEEPPPPNDPGNLARRAMHIAERLASLSA